MDHAIRAEGLVKRFGSTTALAGADLHARTGTVHAVLGPNGAGKTTMVRILTTLLSADAGQASVAGYDVATQPHQVRSSIALTGQYAAVDEQLTGVENLVMVARLLGLPRAEAKRRAAVLLGEFGLDGAAGRAVRTYSGGMRRRLDLAASLVGRPDVLFLDEPTTGLDPRGRAELWEVIRSHVRGGVTVLLTTQYLEEADALADEIVVVDHGLVVASGTPNELKNRLGGQVLEVSPAHADDTDLVARVLAEESGVRAEPSDGTLRVPASVPGLAQAVLRRLSDDGVELAELSLRRPSLDEVFLSLTAGSGPTHDASTDTSTDTSANTSDASRRSA
jgi:oleandomycin transport system ATP-binding protein